jgi:ABC-type branched-subunit amino acid transport system ATPase component
MILQDVSFDVADREIIGIIGPNGCGKTTLLNAISGFLPIETGTISVNGEDVMDLPADRRVRKGVVRGFQHAGVFREMTVEENLMMAVERAEKYPWWWMASSAYRAKMSVAVESALEEVGLGAHKKSLAGVLSGGQLRLLELLRLKILPGNLLLIDEPTAGVAPVLRDTLGKMIRKLSTDHGRTVVIIEHDLRFLSSLAERIIVLVDGQKYLEGTPEEVRRDERLQKIYFGD